MILPKGVFHVCERDSMWAIRLRKLWRVIGWRPSVIGMGHAARSRTELSSACPLLVHRRAMEPFHRMQRPRS